MDEDNVFNGWAYVTFSDVQLDVIEVHKTMTHMIMDKAPVVDGRIKYVGQTAEFGDVSVADFRPGSVGVALKDMGARLLI